MTNYEKYRDLIVKSNYSNDPDNTFCTKFVIPKVLESMGKSCSGVKCDQCRMLMSIWLLDEYKETDEPEIDWSKVSVDTKIYVKDNLYATWSKRYFAKYEKGEIYAWADGYTSWTTVHVTPWRYGKLAEDEEV